MQFQAQVVILQMGRSPAGEVFEVDAPNEDRAATMAQLKAQAAYPGCNPMVKAVRRSGNPFSQEPKDSSLALVEDTNAAPIQPATTDTTEGLRDFDAPKARSFADWTAMHHKTLIKHANHAARDAENPATTKDEALIILKERGLITP